MNMNVTLINKMLELYSIDEIEYNLIYGYVDKYKIVISDNSLLGSYLVHKLYNEDIIEYFKTLSIRTIKDLENYMELLIPYNDRKVNGAFFTPAYIVDYIIQEVKPQINSKCIDPSCGCGAFLIGLAEYYKKQFNKQIKEVLNQNIYGADILNYNVRRAKLLLSLYAAENGESLMEDDFNIFTCDSLSFKWDISFDIVVGNPPYVKFQDLSDNSRDALTANWETTDKGTYNLYFAFFELGYCLLNANGKLGYITPNNYFTSLSGISLRHYFQKLKCIYKIVDFNSTKIFDAQTYTAITFLKKDPAKGILYDRIESEISPSHFLSKLHFSLNQYERLNPKKWRLLKDCEKEFIFKIENNGTAIGKLFDICVGIATLRDKVYFVDTQTEENGYYKKDGFLIEKGITRAVFKISDFKSQSDINNNSRRIIFPYRHKNGTTVPISVEEMEQAYPECYKYLKASQDILNQ